MNSNDFSRLFVSLLDGNKYPNFDKNLVFFDDIVFNKLKEHTSLPPKKFLIENLTPAGLDFILEKYSLEMKELIVLVDFYLNQIIKNGAISKSITSSDLEIFDKNTKSAITHLDQEDIIALLKSHKSFQELVFSLFEDFSNAGYQFTHLTSFSASGLLELVENDFLSSVLSFPNHIHCNLLLSSAKIEDSDLSIISHDLRKDLLSVAICEIALKNQFDFTFNLVEDTVWKRLEESSKYRELFYEMCFLNDIDGLLERSKLKNLFKRWINNAFSLYKNYPSIELARFIAFASQKNYEELVSLGVSLPFSDYLKLTTSTTKIFNLDIVSTQDIDVLDILATVQKNEFNAEKLSHKYQDVGNSISLGGFVASLIEDKHLENNYKSESISKKLHHVNLMLLTFGHKNIANLMDVFTASRIHACLDNMKAQYSYDMTRFKPFLLLGDKRTKEFDAEVQLIVSLLDWQEKNESCDIIDWSQIYKELYSCDSTCLHKLGDDNIRRLAAICVNNILTSPNGALFTLNFMPGEQAGDDSVKWLAYSPDSPVLEGFFKEITNNNSILYAKLVLRQGIEIAQSCDLFSKAMLRVAFNNRVYRESLDKLFPYFKVKEMSMGELKGDEATNFFEVNPLVACDSFQNAISYVPYSYDMVENFCEDADDKEIIRYIKQENHNYMPEFLFEEFMDRKLYVDSNLFSVFFTKAEKILSVKQVEEWKKVVFKYFALKDIQSNSKYLTLFDLESIDACLFQAVALEDMARAKNDNELLEHSAKLFKKILYVYQILPDGEEINTKNLLSSDFGSPFKELVFVLFWKKNFKKTVGLLKSPSFALFAYIYSNILMLNNDDLAFIKEQIEKSHISLKENMLNSLLKTAKETKGVFGSIDWAAKFACFVKDCFPEDLSRKYVAEIINIFPEIYFNEYLKVPQLNIIPGITFEQLLMLSEVAITEGSLFDSEFYCSQELLNNFKGEIYLSSSSNIDLFRQYPVGYAFLSLIQPLTNQKAVEQGWSLALSSSSASVFLTGLKVITTRIVELSSKNNFILLEALSRALKGGGSTLNLIKKGYLSYLRDNHLSLYMYFLDRLGDDNTLQFLLEKTKRAFLEQKLCIFEEFALSVVKCEDGSRKSIVPIEEIYRDVNISDAHSILYYFLDNIAFPLDDLIFVVSRLTSFIADYPTALRDVIMRSSYPYLNNKVLYGQFFVAISNDILQSIVRKHQIAKEVQKIPTSSSVENSYLDKL